MANYPIEIRIRKKAEYDVVLSKDIRVTNQHLTIYGMRNELEFSRFGLIVSKKQGNAVQRNRRKRLLREAIRLNRQDCPSGLDIVIIPRVGQLPSYEKDCKSLIELMKKLARKIGDQHEV